MRLPSHKPKRGCVLAETMAGKHLSGLVWLVGVGSCGVHFSPGMSPPDADVGAWSRSDAGRGDTGQSDADQSDASRSGDGEADACADGVGGTCTGSRCVAADGTIRCEPGVLTFESHRAGHLQVDSDAFRLSVDVQNRPVARIETSQATIALESVWLESEGSVFSADLGRTPPRLHVTRAGRQMVELHLENVVLYDASRAWVGLAEVSLFVHPDRVYWLVSIICNDRDWVVRRFNETAPTLLGTYVYDAPVGHESCAGAALDKVGLNFRLSWNAEPVSPTSDPLIYADPLASILPSFPRHSAHTVSVAGGDPSRWQVVAASSAWVGLPLLAGDLIELGAMMAFGPEVALLQKQNDEQLNPLPKTAFSVTPSSERFGGFDARRGAYMMQGTWPAPASVSDTTIVVTNDALPRRITFDQETIGGIGGALTADARGPAPIPVQMSLNFAGEAAFGERPNSTQVYTVALRANESKTVASTIFNGSTEPVPDSRETIWLNLLEAGLGDGPSTQSTVGILQTMLHDGESSTFRYDEEPYITDFRAHFNDRPYPLPSSHSAMTSFLEFWDASRTRHGLRARSIDLVESGPFIGEYQCAVTSTDGKISGRLRIVTPAHSDTNRIWVEATLSVEQEVVLASTDAPLILLQMAREQAPVRYDRFAISDPTSAVAPYRDSSFEEGSGTAIVHHNGTPLGEPGFIWMYKADNGGTWAGPPAIDYTFSDRAGNPGFILQDFDVVVGGSAMAPGAYVFKDVEGSDGFALRKFGLRPTATLSRLPAGSRLHYRAILFTGGDANSTADFAQAELDRWQRGVGVSPWAGLSQEELIPTIAAAGGAAVNLSGGRDWVPMRVTGLSPNRPYKVYYRGDDGILRDLADEATGGLVYNAWSARDGGNGVSLTVPVRNNTSLFVEVTEGRLIEDILVDSFNQADGVDLNANNASRQTGLLASLPLSSSGSHAALGIFGNALQVPLTTSVQTADMGAELNGRRYRVDVDLNWIDANGDNSSERIWFNVGDAAEGFRSPSASVQAGINIDTGRFYVGLGNGARFETVADVPLATVGESKPGFRVRLAIDETASPATLRAWVNGQALSLSNKRITWQAGTRRTIRFATNGSGIRARIDHLAVSRTSGGD